MPASRKRLRARYGLVIGLVLSVTTPVSAKEPPVICPICHRANDQTATYSEKASTTLVRGAMNTAFGWTELLIEPTTEVKAGGHLAAGIGKGVGLAVKRTAVGLGELLTFWTPKSKTGYLKLSEDCPLCMGKR
ncbi:MAG: hypothetical protein HYZ89_01835 [Candidatus Omnitrophica bacterium]|nr:hypothetical protein [Candidatus Omnitrophota bacterium]